MEIVTEVNQAVSRKQRKNKEIIGHALVLAFAGRIQRSSRSANNYYFVLDASKSFLNVFFV
jgi:hypothetical protein